jgi:hypothetical protein
MVSSLHKPVIAAIVLAVLVATAGSFLLRGSDKTPANSKSDKSALDSTSTQIANPAATDQTSNPSEPAKAVYDSNAALDRRQLLESVGALTSASCYQTYLNIGFIADGKAKGAYSEKDAARILDSVLSLLGSIDRNLAAIGKLELDKQDRESLDQMRDLSDLLRQQGKELKAYWDSGKEEDGARYDNARKDSWAAIGKVTGIGR